MSSFKNYLAENNKIFDNTDKIIEALGIDNIQKFKKHLYGFGIIRIMQAIGRYFYLYEEKDKKEYISKAPKALETLCYLIDNYGGKKLW